MIKNKYPTTKPSLNLDFANTKSLDPRITFRRGTPGTYYDGVTHAKAEENLLSYSEGFAESWWTASRVVLTSGQSAPNGTSTAYKIQQESGQTNAGTFRLTTPLSLVNNKSYTLSIFAKAGTNRNYLIFFTNLTADREMTFFDLANGVVANADERHIARIEGVGNDWYRCSITYTPDSSETGFSTAWNVYFGDNDSSRTVTDNDGFIYVWGAQLEQRDSVTSYTATNGTPITKYQPKLMTAPADSARFDHDPLTGESKGLLIEEQRTNLIAYSEDFKSSFWGKSRDGASDSQEHIYSNQAIAPDGSLSASKVSPGSSSGVHYVGTNQANILENTTYTISCYLKKGEIDTAMLSIWSYANSNEGVSFDLTNGISDASWGGAEILDHSMTHVGNDWYRCAFTVNSGTGSEATSPGFLYLYIDSAGGTIPSGYSGNGFDGLYIWGFQVEKGSFATSYIKTTGATAGTVRSADNASITGENFSSWYRQDEGSLGVDYNLYGIEANSTIFSLIDPDSVQGYINLYCMGATSQQLNCRIENLSATPENMILENTASIGQHNVYVGYSDTNASSVIDSGDILESSISASFKADTLIIGSNTASNVMNGHIKKLAYYPQRLTNEQLQNLTK